MADEAGADEPRATFVAEYLDPLQYVVPAVMDDAWGALWCLYFSIYYAKGATVLFDHLPVETINAYAAVQKFHRTLND